MRFTLSASNGAPFLGALASRRRVPIFGSRLAGETPALPGGLWNGRRPGEVSNLTAKNTEIARRRTWAAPAPGFLFTGQMSAREFAAPAALHPLRLERGEDGRRPGEVSNASWPSVVHVPKSAPPASLAPARFASRAGRGLCSPPVSAARKRDCFSVGLRVSGSHARNSRPRTPPSGILRRQSQDGR